MMEGETKQLLFVLIFILLQQIKTGQAKKFISFTSKDDISMYDCNPPVTNCDTLSSLHDVYCTEETFSRQNITDHADSLTTTWNFVDINICCNDVYLDNIFEKLISYSVINKLKINKCANVTTSSNVFVPLYDMTDLTVIGDGTQFKINLMDSDFSTSNTETFSLQRYEGQHIQMLSLGIMDGQSANVQALSQIFETNSITSSPSHPLYQAILRGPSTLSSSSDFMVTFVYK